MTSTVRTVNCEITCISRSITTELKEFVIQKHHSEDGTSRLGCTGIKPDCLRLTRH
jgi:hypothetical protein